MVSAIEISLLNKEISQPSKVSVEGVFRNVAPLCRDCYGLVEAVAVMCKKTIKCAFMRFGTTVLQTFLDILYVKDDVESLQVANDEDVFVKIDSFVSSVCDLGCSVLSIGSFFVKASLSIYINVTWYLSYGLYAIKQGFDVVREALFYHRFSNVKKENLFAFLKEELFKNGELQKNKRALESVIGEDLCQKVLKFLRGDKMVDFEKSFQSSLKKSLWVDAISFAVSILQIIVATIEFFFGGPILAMANIAMCGFWCYEDLLSIEAKI